MKKGNTSEVYGDILHLPHHVSKKRPQMPIADRAAQFSPFAAVVGHDLAVNEAARYTDQRKELDEMEKNIIDNKLREIETSLPSDQDVEIVFFKPDELKAGGKYIVKVGKVKKFDKYLKTVHMLDGTMISVDDIYKVNVLEIL